VPEDSVAGGGGQPGSVRPPARSNRTVTPAIAGALVVLAASFALAVAFVLANGGLDLPAAQRPSGSSGVTAEGPSSSPTDLIGASGPPSSSATPEPTASPSSAPASPRPSIAATPRPTSSPIPRPSSNRYELLTPCPDAADCWIYVVRQGDNLVSIARYFGVPLQVVQERNPWTTTTPLVAGQQLRLPPPTR
jgi:hypothetical protein